jgi:hypothetical protein
MVRHTLFLTAIALGPLARPAPADIISIITGRSSTG